MNATKLGRVQLLIMQTVWAKGRASARDITDALNEVEPIAHSTVQTLLRGLEDKGAIGHEVDGRTFVFYPKVQEEKFKRSATRDLLERVFGGDVGSLVAHLLKNEKVSRQELSEIRRLIDERGEKPQEHEMNWLDAKQAVLDFARGATGVGVNWLIQSTLLITIGLTVAHLLRRRGSAVQSAIHRTTLAAVLACPLATWGLSALGVSGWSLDMPTEYTYEKMDAAPTVVEAVGPLASVPAGVAEVDPFAQSRVLLAGSSGEGSPLPATLEGLAPPLGPPETEILAASAPLIAAAPAPPIVAAETWLFAIRGFGLVATAVGLAWMAAAAWLLARLILAWRRLDRIRRGALQAETATTDMCAELAARMQVRPPAVVHSPYVPSPCLTGLRTPAVILPDADFSLPVRDVLIHELAHLRRGDCHWNLLRRAGTALFWFQPLLWKLSSRLEATAEEVCDDFVVQWGGDRRNYAHRLVDIAELSSARFAAAGVGMVSLRSMVGRRVARIMDTSRSLSTRVGRTLAAAVLIGGLLGTLAAGLVGLRADTSQAIEAAEASQTEKGVAAVDDSAADAGDAGDDKAKASPTHQHITGRVVDPSGQPLAGVAVVAVRVTILDNDPPTPRLNQDIMAETTSGADGNFELSFTTDGDDGRKTADWHIVAWRRGFGPAWKRDVHLMNDSSPTLKLTEDRRIRGRMVDLEGKPVAGISVSVQSVRPSTGEDAVEKWIKESREREVPNDLREYFAEATNDRYAEWFPNNWDDGGLAWGSPALPPATQTDSDGRFEFRGLGADRLAMLKFEGPGIAKSLAPVVIRDMEALSARPPQMTGVRSAIYYGREFEVVAEPTQAIVGTATDVETGRPLAGLEVRLGQFVGNVISQDDFLTTQTDAHGQYRLEGAPAGGGHRIDVQPSADQPYFATSQTLPAAKNGFEPIACNFELRRGRWIVGKVTEADGKPIDHATVQYLPLRENKLATDYSNYDPQITGMGPSDRFHSSKDGSFRVLAIPGAGVLFAIAEGADKAEFISPALSGFAERLVQKNGYTNSYHPWTVTGMHALREVSVDETKDDAKFDLTLIRGQVRVLNFVDADGQPVTGTDVLGRMAPPNLEQAIDGSSVKVIGLGPEEMRSVIVLHTKRRIGAALTVGPGDDRKVVLQPCGVARGRVIDGLGEPHAGLDVSVSIDHPDNWMRRVSVGKTDAEGRFELLLPPGTTSRVARYSMGGPNFSAECQAEPGAVFELGDLIDGAELKLADTSKLIATRKTIEAATAGKVDDDVVTVHGRVLDPAGRPLAGADVYALRWYWDFGDPKPLAQTKSDAAGRFEISYRKSQFIADAGRPNQWREVYIAGFAAGAGPGWAEYDKLKPGEEAEVRLVKDDVPIEGRVVDLEGNPVAGATIEVGTLHTPAGDDLADWLKAVGAGESLASASRALGESLPYFSPNPWPKQKTDADGRFRYAGFGRERVAEIHLSGPTIVSDTVRAATRAMKPVVHPAYDYAESDSVTEFGATFQYTAAPSRPIEGVVRDAATGEPIAGVEIWSHQFAGQSISGIHTIKAKSDAQGHYRLEGMPKGEGNELLAVPADLPYFTMALKVPNPPGGEAAKFDVALHRGAWVTGRVTDKATGRGVSAHLYYIPYPDNAEALKLPEFADNSHIMDVQDRYRTAADGSYRVVALPGRGVVAALAVLDPYPGGQGFNRIRALKEKQAFRKFGSALAPTAKHPTAVKEISVAGVDHRLTCDFALDPGQRVRLRVVDAAGAPVDGATVSGVLENSNGQEPVPAEGIDLLAFREGESRTVLVQQTERRLGKGLHVSAKDSAAVPVTVTLDPCATVTGRLVDGAGEPVRGAALRFEVATDGDYGKVLMSVTTDGEGRFKHEGLLPGLPYAIFAEGGKMAFVTVAKSLEVQPGEKIDLGEIDISSDKRPKPMRTAAAPSGAKPDGGAAATKDHALRIHGRVTTPDGKNAAGVHVAAMAASLAARRGGDYSPTPVALVETTTDADGGYELTLPGVTSKTHRGGQVIAGADGFGLAWKELDLDAQDIEAALALEVEKPISARLIDVDGQPAAGVTLNIGYLMKTNTNPDANWSGVGLHEGTVTAAWPGQAVSDADGKFTVRRVPAGYGVSLSFHGSERFAQQDLLLNSGQAEQRLANDGTYRSLVKNAKPGETPSLPLAPAQLIVGTVTYEDTGAPAPHARLSIWASQQEYGSMMSVDGQADAEGHYRISPQPGIRFGVQAYAPDRAPYLARRVPPVTWQDADHEKKIDVALPRGVIVRGKVIEAGTGAPVAGASVQYTPESDNNKTLPGGVVYGWEAIQTSDPQGKYSIVVPPGPGRLLVHAPRNEFVVVETSDRELSSGLPGGERSYAHAVERIDPAADAGALDMTVRLKRGGTVTGELVDAAGAPIASATMLSTLLTHPTSIFWRGSNAEAARDGRFTISGLASGRDYTVCFLDAQRRLGATATLKAGMAPRRVLLQPCGSARMRILDGAGKPMADYSPTVHFVMTPGFERLGPLASKATKTGLLASDSDFISNVDRLNHPSFEKTDAEGRVEIGALIPGATYRILLYGNKAYDVATDFKVEAGQATDLGDFRVVTEETMADSAAAAPAVAPVAAVRTETADKAASTTTAGKLLSGRVVAANGKPVSGAKLYWFAWSLRGEQSPPAPLATTNAAGEFQFTQPDVTSVSPGTAVIINQQSVVVAAGHGMLLGPPFQPGGAPNIVQAISQALALSNKQTTIALPTDAAIKGRIVNVDGEPVAGARLSVRKLDDGNPRSYEWRTKELEARGETKNLKWRARVLDFVAHFAPPQLAACAPTAVSDADGRFELAGIGADRLVELLVEGDGLETKLVLARTNPGEDMIIEADSNFMLENRTLYGPELTLVAGPSKPVEGRVLDLDTGEPIAGAIVRTYAVHGESLNTTRERQQFSAQTDAQGRYRIAGLPLGDGNKLAAFTVGDEPYVPIGHVADTAKAEASLTLDFRLKRGVWAEGRAYDAESKTPRAGELSYYLFRNAKIEREIPGLRDAFVDDQYFTDADGKFRVPVLASRCILAFRYSPVDGSDMSLYPRGAGVDAIGGLQDLGGLKAFETMTHYMIPSNFTAVVEVAPKAGSQQLDVDFALSSGTRLTVRPVDEAGKALTGLEFYGQSESYGWERGKGPICDVTGLVPGKSRKLLFFDRERNLAGAIVVDSTTHDGIEVTLRPAARVHGRMVNEDGEPIADATIYPDYEGFANEPKASIWPDGRQLSTNASNLPAGKDGRFEIVGLVPDWKYNAHASAKRKFNGAMMQGGIGDVFKNLTVKPGEDRDLGDVVVKSN